MTSRALLLMLVAAVLPSIATAKADDRKLVNIRASVLDALKATDDGTNKKCSSSDFNNDATAQACEDCGCTSCPCCKTGGDACPPEDSVTCLQISTSVSNGGEDPLACANDLLPGSETCQFLDTDGDGGVSREECNAVVGSGGNLCMWYSYTNPDNVYGGSCLFNTCSNVNDGSCTLQQTGGRCVWYGNPNNLRTINGVKEIPNPYQETSGCYISPCNNPSGINPFTGEERGNNPSGCESENPYNGYKCQWCYTKTATQGMTMGCQNVYETSSARASNIAAFPEQGSAPCGNYYCNFFDAPGRTNNATATYPTQCAEGQTCPETYTWVSAYGTGKQDDMCVCPAGNAEDTAPMCPDGVTPTPGAF